MILGYSIEGCYESTKSFSFNLIPTIELSRSGAIWGITFAFLNMRFSMFIIEEGDHGGD